MKRIEAAGGAGTQETHHPNQPKLKEIATRVKLSKTGAGEVAEWPNAAVC